MRISFMTRMVAAAAGVYPFACGTTGHSLHPLVTTEEAVADSALLGRWAVADGSSKEEWIFIPSDNHSYVLVVGDSIAGKVVTTYPEGLPDDSATQARLKRDPVFRRQRVRDSLVFERLMPDSLGPRIFAVVMARFGGELFMDLTPFPSSTGGHTGRIMTVPMHWFWRATLEKTRMVLTPLSDGWLKEQLDSGRVTLSHDVEADDLVITAPTVELQALVARYAHDAEAFKPKSAVEFRKRK